MIKDLIARLETASEGSPFLDMEIARFLGWRCPGAEPPPYGMNLQDIHDWWGLNWFSNEYREAHGNVRDFPFTSSLDTALTLVPEYDTSAWSVSRNPDRDDIRPCGVVMSRQGSRFGDGEVFAATPALALCIAALKARAG